MFYQRADWIVKSAESCYCHDFKPNTYQTHKKSSEFHGASDHGYPIKINDDTRSEKINF
jgi:hypothetical protein